MQRDVGLVDEAQSPAKRRFRNLNHSIATLNPNTPFSATNNSSNCQSTTVASIPTKPNKYMLRNAKRFAKAFPTPLDRSWFLWPDSFQQAYIHASATPNSSHSNQSKPNSSEQTLPPLSETYRLPWAARELTGIIPRALGSLQKLTYLNLSGNHLHGTIPSDLGNLTSLIELDLSSNAFIGGGIPKEFGNLVRLRRLNLSNNALGGCIPVELSRMENLETLFLVCMGLSGEIPSELSRLAKLKELHISCNRGLRGVIPQDLGNCALLEILCLSGNALTGCIPRQLSLLEKLKVCDLSTNRLIGQVPVELVQLPLLQELKLGGNGLAQPCSSVNARNGIKRADSACETFLASKHPVETFSGQTLNRFPNHINADCKAAQLYTSNMAKTATAAAAAAAAATTATWSDSSTLLTDSEDETPLVEIGRRLRMSRISASQRDSRDKRVSFNAGESNTHNRASPSATTVQMPAHKSRKPFQSALKKNNSCMQLSGKSTSVSTLRLGSKSMSVSASIPVYKSSSDPLDHVPIAMLGSGSMQQRSLSAQPSSRATEEPCDIVDDIMRASSVSSVLPFIPPRHVAVMSDTPARSLSISRMSPSIEASPEMGSSLKQRSNSFMSLRKPFSKASVKGIANRVTDTCCTHRDYAVGTGITKLAADEPKHVQRTSISVERNAISNRSLSMPTFSNSSTVKKRWNWVWARK
ncbi:hypothetical protein CcCBS67573_g04162 [Chytriomyces confervae]|uniref:Disease resistance R13L4/SHOC-2-like LRR domain-containing protein n=1 Tax=Chytriomyces confervae TaxID=246404 RepID=A0A507FE01_9FUNG|nr:hypothetical protein CcCBS67573_g04162 [Chytriomyces confervae]